MTGTLHAVLYLRGRNVIAQKFYSLTIAHKKQQQQPVPVYEDIVGQPQNIELKENVAYGPVQEQI